MIKSRNVIATPPGATIKEQLTERGLSQKEFAVRMGLSEKHISKLIHGQVQLTPEVALRLEMVLGIPARFWNKLEATYREKLIRANLENEMDADLKLLKRFPYSEMQKYGWVPETRKQNERVIYLRKYFEVVRLSLIESRQVTRIACRRSAETEKSDYALLSWAQEAKREARAVHTHPVDLKTLTERIPWLRGMTRMQPEQFCGELCRFLAECGIALIFLPHIGGSFLNGATFYDGPKIVVGLTVRGRDADRFWFSFFHELGHILLGHVSLPDGTSEEDEAEADRFARETLIPSEPFRSFVKKNNFSKKAVSDFSDTIGIDRGIVVGRLQKESYIPYYLLNDLKTKYLLQS